MAKSAWTCDHHTHTVCEPFPNSNPQRTLTLNAT